MNKENRGAAAPRKTLVIERERWLRGGGNGVLFRPSDGKMCCLGFFGLACGARPGEMAACGRPDEVLGEDIRWPRWLVHHGARKDDGEDLIHVNDAQTKTDAERELTIARIFAKHGVDVVFK